jgi:hypothetical protein
MRNHSVSLAAAMAASCTRRTSAAAPAPERSVLASARRQIPICRVLRSRDADPARAPGGARAAPPKKKRRPKQKSPRRPSRPATDQRKPAEGWRRIVACRELAVVLLARSGHLMHDRQRRAAHLARHRSTRWPRCQRSPDSARCRDCWRNRPRTLPKAATPAWSRPAPTMIPSVRSAGNACSDSAHFRVLPRAELLLQQPIRSCRRATPS